MYLNIKNSTNFNPHFYNMIEKVVVHYDDMVVVVVYHLDVVE
jgi:hypothetical protein